MHHRQDAWSEKDDKYLAETVLHHIKSGSTQLRAFDEIGDQLDRTSAACGFRWNALIRQRYIDEIKQAKKERKKLLNNNAKAAVSKINESSPNASANIPAVVNLLEKALEKELNTFQNNSDSKYQDTESLEIIHSQLVKEAEEWREKYTTMQKEYQMVASMLNRARLLAAEETDLMATTFKMDQNGNLEKYNYQ
ncbi:RsfA family transcriptional regulator [Alteribacillus sp. HJP-4]|uniref:RsfA family transcriptional regulator n=1 Tax=Alteribacillus sp. HJP-4 TaxID=2775394 RepID=UPI0035CCCC8F